MAFGFFLKSFTNIKRELTSKSYFWVRNSSFVLAPRYCRRSKLVFTSFCFQNVPKPELTSAARTMDRNSQKWSQKGYHSLSFAAKVSVWRSFEQFHSLINRHETSRIIQFHHVTYTKERFFWPRVETRLLLELFFLPFGTPDSGSKFRRYLVFIRYHCASAGMTKGNRLWKRKRNVLRRDDYFYFHHCSFQICITCFVVNNKYTAVTNGFKLCSLISVHTHMRVRNLQQKYSNYDE